MVSPPTTRWAVRRIDGVIFVLACDAVYCAVEGAVRVVAPDQLGVDLEVLRRVLELHAERHLEVAGDSSSGTRHEQEADVLGGCSAGSAGTWSG